jgi:hypothetical protein
MGLKLGRRLFEHRRHRLARAAPRGPKVDQERQIAPFGMGREPTGIQRQRLALKQGAAASSALASLAQAAARHAIERIAMGTGNVKAFGHGKAPFHNLTI